MEDNIPKEFIKGGKTFVLNPKLGINL